MRGIHQLLDLIRKKVMYFVNLEEEDCEVWDNGIRTGEIVHKYFVYGNEPYERKELTKEEFETLKAFTEVQ